MKTTTFFAVAVLLLSASTFVSCEKDGDVTKPVIELSEPEDGEEFLPGSEICIEMDLSDDTALASFKINIHNAFDGHSHDSDDEGSGEEHNHDDENYNTDTENAFYYNQTSEELDKDVFGLRNSHQHIHLEIPSTAAYGDYHLMIYCYDTAGNESYVARSIAITADAEEHEHDHDEE